MKKIIYKMSGRDFFMILIFLILLCLGSSGLNAQQKISISPLSASDASGSAVSETSYDRNWSDPMMTKSDKLDEGDENARSLSASSLLYFDHYDIDKSFVPDEYPDIFSYPGIVSEPISCPPPTDILECTKTILNDAFPEFVESGFTPEDSAGVGKVGTGSINETPVIADINSDKVVWPYLVEPYADIDKDRTYPATIGIDPIMFIMDNLLSSGSEISFDLVGFNATEFGDDILVPIYNTTAMVGPFSSSNSGSPESMKPSLYFSPIAAFRKDADTGRIKLNGYADSFNMSLKEVMNAINSGNYSSINSIPNAVDLFVVFNCLNALKSINTDLSNPIYPYYSIFADFGAVGNKWDMPKVCSLSLLRFISYMHSNPTDIVVYKDNVVVINQMPILNANEVMEFGRPVLIKESDNGYKSKKWGEYLKLEDADLWSSAVIYQCKEESSRTGYFNDDCSVKGFTLIPANSYNAVAVEDGVLVATPSGIYHFDPSVDFPNVGYMEHQSLNNKSIPIARRVETDIKGSQSVVPYGISVDSNTKDNYVAITYRTIGEESLEEGPFEQILKDKRIFMDAGFADFIHFCKYQIKGTGADKKGELTDCEEIRNGSIKSAIVDADLKDIDDDGYMDIAFTDLVLGGVDDGSNFYRSHVCYKMNPLDCQEVKMGDLSGDVGKGPRKIDDVNKYMKENPEYLGTSKIVASKGVISAIFGGRPPMVPNGGCSSGEKDDPVFSLMSHITTFVQKMAYDIEQSSPSWAYQYLAEAKVAYCSDSQNCTQAELNDIAMYHAYPVASLLENSMCTEMNACKMTVGEKKYAVPLWGKGTKTLLEKTKDIATDHPEFKENIPYEYCCQENICDGYAYRMGSKYGWCYKMICCRGDDCSNPAPQVESFCTAVEDAWKEGGECTGQALSVTVDDLPETVTTAYTDLELKDVRPTSAPIPTVAQAEYFATTKVDEVELQAVRPFARVKNVLETGEEFTFFMSFIQNIMKNNLTGLNINGAKGSSSSTVVKMMSPSSPHEPSPMSEPLTPGGASIERYRMPPGIPMEGKFQIGTVILNKVTSGISEKECVTEGFSSNYMKSVVESIQMDAKEAWGVITGAGELGYSTVKCRAKIANAKDEYIVGYTKGPLPINFAAESRYPETIKLLDKAVTIAPLDASYTVKSMSGNKGDSTAGFDISQSTLVSIPVSVSSLSSEMNLDINRLSDDVGIVINNHIGHTILKSAKAAKSSDAENPEIVHEIFVNVIDPCASWTARGGGGEKCPAPEMNVALLKSEGKWDDRYVYVFKIVNGTKGGIEEDEIRVIGVDGAMFGRGGGCLCNVNATPPTVYEMMFGMFIMVVIGSGFVFARQRAKRKK